MSDEETDNPAQSSSFDDLLDDVQDASFDWDDEELEAEEEEQTRPVVCFRIGRDLFAIAGDSVREISGSTEITELPGAPAHIEGITVLRRQVVGLLSLRNYLNLDADRASDAGEADGFDSVSTDRTLIVETAHYTVGIYVDEVTGLDEWPESYLDPQTLPETIRDETRRYARGARQQQGTMCVFLDLETLLDDASIQ